MHKNRSSNHSGISRRRFGYLAGAAGLSGFLPAFSQTAQIRPYVIMLGPPASGKTNHAGKINEHFGIPVISAAAVVERHIADRTRATGRAGGQSHLDRMREVLRDLRNEELVADAALNAIVTNRIRRDDCANGFALDGYPNNVDQARYFNSFVAGGAVHPYLDADQLSAIYLNVPDEVALERMRERGRVDDQGQFAVERLKVFRANADALLDYYRGPHFFTIETTKPEDDVAAAIRAFLNKRYS